MSAPDRRARTQASDGPAFVGRDEELAELTRALAARQTVTLIEGEAGIGKSRLLREYLRSPAGLAGRVLLACCPPFRQPHTLAPVTDALRPATDSLAGLRLTSLAGALRPLFPEWAADLPPLPEPLEDPTALRHRLFRALGELIGSLRTGVVAIEDAHWADEATLEFLLYLASCDPRPVSLVVTYRPEEVPPGSLLPRLSRLAAGSSGLRLSLAPLSMADTGALMSSLLAGRQVPDEFAAFVHQRTEGVPLAVEEMVRLMADRSDFTHRDGETARRSLAEIIVPPTVRDAVLERAGRLSAEAQAMLAAAAVVADEAEEALLSAVSALPAQRARAGLTEALRSRLLGETAHGLLSFRHSLAAQAIYEAIPGPERRALHLRAAQALEICSAPPALRLARHFRASGEPAKWAHYAELAADRALAVGDEATAAVQLHDLILDPHLLGDRRAVRLLRKVSCAWVANPDYLWDLVRSVRSWLDAWTGEPADEAEVRFHLSRILSSAHEHEASTAELKRAVIHLGGNPGLAARAMLMLAWPDDMKSPASAHLRWLRRAAQVTSCLEPSSQLQLDVKRVIVLLQLGQEDGWALEARIAESAASACDDEQIASEQLNSGDLAMGWGRYTDARRRLAKALDLAEAHGYQYYRALIAATMAHLDWFTGAWKGLAERTQALADEEGNPIESRLEATLITGLLSSAAGDVVAAEACLQAVLAERRRRGAPYYLMEPAAALARLWLADGRIEEAVRVTDEPVAVLAAKRTWIWAADVVPARVEALAVAGKIDEATDLASAFGRGLRGRNAPAPKTAVLLCRALLAQARGQHSRAATLFGQVATSWQSLPRPYDALLAQERQCACMLSAGRHDEGTALLMGVLGDLSRLGAVGDAARVARRLREFGAAGRQTRPRGRRGYGNQLSPREVDVARLLVAGGTNREIGQQLFVSPKTVARHLDSAMRKLGVGSRTALAVRLVEEGIIGRKEPGAADEAVPDSRSAN